MKRKKENLLINYKESPSGCLCQKILELKREKLFQVYESLRKRVARQKAKGKIYERTLNNLLKIGNKMRAVKEAISEINDTYDKIEKMVEIEINEQTIFRLSHNSDRRRSCYKKVPHSKESAENTALEMIKRTGERLESYKCRHCEFWHVGHSVRES